MKINEKKGNFNCVYFSVQKTIHYSNIKKMRMKWIKKVNNSAAAQIGW